MRKLALVVAAAALAGCGGIPVPTEPDSINLEPQRLSEVRAPQTIALKNGYAGETVVKLNNNPGTWWTTDLHKLTETAIIVLRRGLEKQGITVAPEAPRTLTLRVVAAQALPPRGPFNPMSPAFVALEVVNERGQKIRVSERNTGFSGQRAVDGAILFTLNKLLANGGVLNYLNGFQFACLPQDTYVVGERLVVAETVYKVGEIIGADARCKSAERPVALRITRLEGDEVKELFTLCVAASLRAGEKLMVGPLAATARSATIERVLGPSPRCDDPQRKPTRVEARYDDHREAVDDPSK